MTTMTPTIGLRTGGELPRVGLGVYQSEPGAETRDAVIAALEIGYRHIDTAKIYANEADVGAAVRMGGVPRSEVFVTTKLWNSDQGYDAALRAFDASLSRLGLEYVDLYLIHWPVAGAMRKESWRALEKLHADGRARAIGVSNYLVPHLNELVGYAKELPAVNQIELSPFLQRRDTCALCNELGIVLEAYSPLTRGEKLDHPVVRAVASELARSPAQVLIRWGLEKGFVSLPKSVTPARIAENLAVFDFALTPAQLERLDALEENLATGWDPARQA